MGGMKSETIPDWLWRLAVLALLGAVLIMVLLLLLALGGISNPRRIGELVVRDELDRDAGWLLRPGDALSGAHGAIDADVYQVVLSRSNVRSLALAPYSVQPPCTLMIAARQIEGPTDAGYGLWWGDAAEEDYHVAAVNGDGYLTVFQSTAGVTEAIVQWQVFPRIHSQGNTNTIQVDIGGGQVLVRVNDEVAAAFEWAADRPLEAGFYTQTLSAGGAVVAFDWLAIWQESGSLP
jgi:hypothetical protein